MVKLKIISVLSFVLLATASATSQGQISGSTADNFGVVVPDAEITLVRLSKGGEKLIAKVRSNGDGKFDFPQVATAQ